MIKVKNLEQHNLFGDMEPQTITIDDSAKRLGVSTATIRNWVKTRYLEQAGTGKITLKSLETFESDVSGKEKLTKRANKSLKDSHNHEETLSIFLDEAYLLSEASEKIGIEYETTLSDSYRNKEGVYYTPSEIVRDLFTVSDSVKDNSFCDPCCGSGNFIIRALELGFKPEHIYGFDVDPVAVEITKARIYKATGYKSSNIKVANFLDIASEREAIKYDYIYTNPPWGKKIAKDTRVKIGSILGAGSSIDTCSLFLFACIKCLNKDGKLGLLLPESFFNIAVFEDARKKTLQLSIERLIDYGKVFRGLVTKAQAIVLRNNVIEDSSQEILCETKGSSYKRKVNSFRFNPKSILNLYCNNEDAETLQYIMSVPHISLKNKASWGLGIVTGNNKRFIKSSPGSGYIPVYKGSDIQPEGLKEPSNFIPSDMSLYQQVAPLFLYKAKKKLIYKFISSKLCFFYDDKQRFILNSANMLIPDEDFPVSTKVLAELLSSNYMNWVFSRIFNTHKILRSDLESLPIHNQFLEAISSFNEDDYLNKLNIEKSNNGTYRIKR